MKVSALNTVNTGNNRKYNPSFNGYYEVLREGARTSVKNLKEADMLFGDLIKEIDNDAQIVKEPLFKTLKSIFNEGGLKGLFEEITKKSAPRLMIEDMLELVKKEEVISVARNKGHVFDVVSYGGKPKDVRLGFASGLKKGYIEFYTNKKGDIFVDRAYGDNFVSTGFYSDAGTKKVEVEAFGSSKPDKTYYNKDGSKPFFKNWFLGGTPVEPIY